MNYLNLIIIFVIIPASIAVIVSALLQSYSKKLGFEFPPFKLRNDDHIMDSIPEVLFE